MLSLSLTLAEGDLTPIYKNDINLQSCSLVNARLRLKPQSMFSR